MRELLKGWVSKFGTPCRFFKFEQQSDQRHVYVEEIPDDAVSISAEIGAWVTWSEESDKQYFGNFGITDSRLNNMIGKKVRVIVIPED